MTASDPHTTSREVPGALAWGLIAKTLVSVLAIASNVLIVRGLGEDAYGVYSIFLNIARFLALAIGLGLAQGLLQFLPELRVKNDARGTRQLLWRVLLLQFVGWLGVLAVVVLLRGWISTLYAIDLREILLLGSALLIFEVLWTAFNHVYIAARRMRHFTLVSVLQRGSLIVLLVLLLQRGLTIPAVMYAVAGSFVVGILALTMGVRRAVPWMAGAEGEGIPLSRLMKYALPIALGALINQVLWRSSETLVLGYYWEPKVAGYFNAAYNLPQMLLEFIPLSIWPIMLASLSEVHTRRADDLLRGIALYFRLTIVLVVPIALTGLALGGQMYLLLYAEAMAPGAPICQLFFLIFLISFMVMPLRMALYVKERPMVNALIAGAGAVVNVALDFVFIPRMGLWGAVPPVAIALLVSGGIQLVVTRRLLPGIGFPWGHLLKVVAGSAVVLPLWLLRDSLDSPFWLIAALAGGTLVQAVVLRMLGVFGAEERDLLLRSNLPLKKLVVRLLVRD